MSLLGQLDGAVMDVAARMHQPWLDPVLTVITHLGDQIFLTGVVLTAALVLWMRRLRRPALILTAAALAGFPLSEGVKVLVDRPRPDVAWRRIDLPSSPSFPSGHALESTIVYGALALLVGRRLRRGWLAAAALGVLVPLLIGASRVYLGVHYFTDVLAGWAAGLAVALLAAWVDLRWGRGRGRSDESR